MNSAEPENQACSDEESINCRPLPNYKHKKYLRSKFEEAMMNEANSSGVEPNGSMLGNNKQEKVNNKILGTAAAQPPLPPNPPPPDTPPMIINLKQEIKDDEYECGTTETSSEFSQPEELKATTATIKTDKSEDKPNVTMCRNFARGTCKKGAACIFAHELILSQLPGVYTFCRNFQNSVCSFPKCKFVHATVFEKEHFFRTGYLPPHTLAHLKEQSVPQPPLPPSQPEEASAAQPAVYCNAPPPVSCFPPVAVQNNIEVGIERVECSTNTVSPKGAWNEIEEASSTTRECDSAESLTKRCKNCASSELSEQLMKARVAEATLRNKERMQKIAHINKKNSLLTTVLKLCLKPNTSNHTAELLTSADKNINLFQTTSNHTAGLQMSADQDINNLLSPNQNNLTALLAKLLKNMQSGLPPDSS